MNNLCLDVGYKSIYHAGEELCGDHVNEAKTEDGRHVVVLADGLGSGVKASILSTITSQMIATLLSNGIDIEDTVKSVTKTLPVDKEKNVAYSTFSIADFNPSGIINLVQFDNPDTIMIRDGKIYDFPKKKHIIGDRNIYESTIELNDGDLIAMFSDGCPYASANEKYNMSFGPDAIKDFFEVLYAGGANATTVANEFIEYVNKLYERAPRDDATCAVIKVRKRTQVNVVYGPPSNAEDEKRIMSLFFSKGGKHVVCGGTTAKVVAKYLEKEIEMIDSVPGSDVPPMERIDGVDLVTEGIITMGKIKEYAEDFLEDNILYQEWGFKKDPASILARLLFEEATDIDFYIGKAVNPAHQDDKSEINFSVKMSIIQDVIEALKKMGKNVKSNYF